MKWQTKSKALQILTFLPGTDHLHYFTQRYVTRTLPRAVEEIRKCVAIYGRHIEAFRSRAIELDKGLLLTFGAGWDLLENLTFYGYGVNRQLVLDQKPLAQMALINGLVAYLRQHPFEGAASRPFVALDSDMRHELLDRYGIDYRAPADARAVPLSLGRVDMIATTYTLEHIPKETIVEIMWECRRLIAPFGVVSMLVDYSDHFSHNDPSISCYNFLSIEAQQWCRHNVDRHFQNRLRHSDFVRIFEAAGFEIVMQQALRPPDWERLIALQPIAPEFAAYEVEDLAITTGYFLLTPSVRRTTSPGSSAPNRRCPWAG